MNQRDAAIDYIKHFIGTWYKWGGDDPAGFDCSGLVIEYLKSAGLIGRGKDYTAQGLYDFLLEEMRERSCDHATPGGLVFYQRGGRIVHVEICLDHAHQLGASGGGSKTTDVTRAIEHNAFIKRRPLGSTQGVPGAILFLRLFDAYGNRLHPLSRIYNNEI
jgi:cell wall-associated NlpC family hydrolase